ncbi:hypothetical protein OLMES_5215 [Oleiphilus messinensis]|uniref:Uncharacterized protein n=1 Tax=Oleiphilus messinensis TaxID=141451 RepID=A0A1Y0IGF4_9GAMM|nr:YbjQ family protein [Oleiphilus messinensis]ARU59199.1 hypothetical protein OLMES_5215 [Oleiphilus messinensis]
MEAVLQISFFFCLLAAGYFFGRRAEKKHYQSIFEREAALRYLVISSDRMPPPEYLKHHGELVCGNVVISLDYFKFVAAGLYQLVGGRIPVYESLLDRARREALLRMQAEAQSAGADAIINLKFETSRISGNAGNGIGSIEVLAYGTALIPKTP